MSFFACSLSPEQPMLIVDQDVNLVNAIEEFKSVIQRDVFIWQGQSSSECAKVLGEDKQNKVDCTHVCEKHIICKKRTSRNIIGVLDCKTKTFTKIEKNDSV